MIKSVISVAVSAALVSGAAVAGSFNFTPIDSSASDEMWTREAPFKIPAGFGQYVVKDESTLNIYDNGRDDWHDMNTTNETGKKTGRFMYTTHELRLPAALPEGGTVTAHDLKTGKTVILDQDPSYNALDGIKWTPWGTILFAEETTGGRLFEIVLNDDMMSGTTYDRPAVGRIAHEGIDIDEDGNVYVVDEFRGEREGYGGGIYKFVPDAYGDLSSGDLYVLGTSEADGTGQGAWLGPIDASDARNSGTDFGGHGYNRPEDLEIIDGVLYAAITEGPRNGTSTQEYDGRVIAINLESMMVSNFVVPGKNAPVEIGRPGDANFQTGFDNPDNLAESPDGRLVIVEDNVPSDVWFAGDADGDGVADSIDLFASLSDYGAEGTGIYFIPGKSNTMYINIQHSKEQDGDGTWAIKKGLSKGLAR
jgi:secreted PhoX family phosphatase